MEPYEVLALVRRFTPLLLAHLVLGAIAGYAVAAFSPPVFTIDLNVEMIGGCMVMELRVIGDKNSILNSISLSWTDGLTK